MKDKDIFISWGKPDEEMVKWLSDRLGDLGLSVWEYTDSMRTGDQIPPTVLAQINRSRVAVVCLSDQSAPREWIVTEAAWLYDAQRDSGKPLQHILPVQVGPLSPDTIPQLLRGEQLYTLDLTKTDMGLEGLGRLVDDIQHKLGKDSPLVMPAALFAMNRAQSDIFFADLQKNWKTGGEQAVIWDLCKMVGMQDPPELFTSLPRRYGETRYDLMPFASEGKQPVEKFVDILNKILRDVNQARVAENHRPVFLRWLTEELTSTDLDEKQAARDLWSAGDSLLVVDSVSTFHPEISMQLLRAVPQSEDPSRAAVLWIPPYTQHTVSLDESVRRSAQYADYLGDLYARLERQPRRAVSFDTGTPLAVRLWLRRALAGVSDNLSALPGNVKSMPPPATWKPSGDGPQVEPPPEAEPPSATGKLKRMLSHKSQGTTT